MSDEQQERCEACALVESQGEINAAQTDAANIVVQHNLKVPRAVFAALAMIRRIGWRAGVHAGWAAANQAHHRAHAQRERELGGMPPHQLLLSPAHGPHGGH